MRNFYDLLVYDIPNLIKNIWRFRYSLWNYQTWDYVGVLLFMRDGLTHLSTNFQHDGSERETTQKKNISIIRVIEILNNTIDDDYYSIANKQLGEINFPPFEFLKLSGDSYELISKKSPKEEKEYKKRIKLSIQLEKDEWDELFRLLKGQDYSKFDNNKDWNDQYDGSGIKTWWE